MQLTVANAAFGCNLGPLLAINPLDKWMPHRARNEVLLELHLAVDFSGSGVLGFVENRRVEAIVKLDFKIGIKIFM